MVFLEEISKDELGHMSEHFIKPVSQEFKHDIKLNELLKNIVEFNEKLLNVINNIIAKTAITETDKQNLKTSAKEIYGTYYSININTLDKSNIHELIQLLLLSHSKAVNISNQFPNNSFKERLSAVQEKIKKIEENIKEILNKPQPAPSLTRAQSALIPTTAKAVTEKADAAKAAAAKAAADKAAADKAAAAKAAADKAAADKAAADKAAADKAAVDKAAVDKAAADKAAADKAAVEKAAAEKAAAEKAAADKVAADKVAAEKAAADKAVADKAAADKAAVDKAAVEKAAAEKAAADKAVADKAAAVQVPVSPKKVQKEQISKATLAPEIKSASLDKCFAIINRWFNNNGTNKQKPKTNFLTKGNKLITDKKDKQDEHIKDLIKIMKTEGILFSDIKNCLDKNKNLLIQTIKPVLEKYFGNLKEEDYKNKYLKYKMKYLELKQKLNI